jgi:hypothetical protein
VDDENFALDQVGGGGKKPKSRRPGSGLFPAYQQRSELLQVVHEVKLKAPWKRLRRKLTSSPSPLPDRLLLLCQDEGARVLEMRCAEGHLKASKHIINCLPLTNDI